MTASRIREMFEKSTGAFNRHDIEEMGQLLTDDIRTRAPARRGYGKLAVKAF